MKWEVSWPQHRGFTIEIDGMTWVNGEVKVYDSEADIPEAVRSDQRFPRWPARYPLARVDTGYRSAPLTEEQYIARGGTVKNVVAAALAAVGPGRRKPKARKPRPPKPPGTGTKPDAPAAEPDKPHTGEDEG